MDVMNKHRVVCFGEVLWDVFPSGAEAGGAPMNVAYHLHKQKKDPTLITRIGIDEEGKKLIDIFSRKGVCTEHFQVDYAYATGKVYAKPNEHHETVYDIVMPAAWDFIQWEDGLKQLVEDAEFFVFGSLAARNRVSKDTLFRLLEIARKKVLDLNLRAPYFNRPVVEQLLGKADLVKMNQAELELITGWFSHYTSVEDRVKSIRDKFAISEIVVTMGAEGALLYRNGDITLHRGFKVAVEDTVGSGDAFLAGLLSQLLDNADSEAALRFANGLGAFVATQRGACPDYDIEDFLTAI
jgi:fructokinase